MSSAALSLALVAVTRSDGLLDLCFHRFEVEARALLHGRKVDRRLAELGHFLLHEHTPPELIHVPVNVCDRLVEACALVGIGRLNSLAVPRSVPTRTARGRCRPLISIAALSPR